MTIARAHQVNFARTKYYHCVSRCVRRVFLCGLDVITGKDYSYRKAWILERIKTLSNIFAIDICAYAIMSNHTHLVLHVDIEKMNNWSEDEVRERWQLLFPKNYADFFHLTEKALVPEQINKIAVWRQRLASISWFMACLNEKIARMCNQEDDCTGRFWEGRYKCQALLDQGAILSAMVYVDLNPVRAAIVQTPEESKFTSIYDRIQAIKQELSTKTQSENDLTLLENLDTFPEPQHLLSLKSNNNLSTTLDFCLFDYLQLVDCTGKIFSKDKKGKIPDKFLPILKRLQLNPNNWLDYIYNLEHYFSFGVGESDAISLYFKENKIIKTFKKIKNYYKKAA